MFQNGGKGLKGTEGYSSAGAVVGATFPEEAEILRKQMKDTIFLVPGYGAQGGTADAAVNCFNPDGRGAVINSSRGIIYSWINKGDGKNYMKYTEEAALEMKRDIETALKKGNKYRW